MRQHVNKVLLVASNGPLDASGLGSARLAVCWVPQVFRTEPGQKSGQLRQPPETIRGARISDDWTRLVTTPRCLSRRRSPVRVRLGVSFVYRRGGSARSRSDEETAMGESAVRRRVVRGVEHRRHGMVALFTLSGDWSTARSVPAALGALGLMSSECRAGCGRPGPAHAAVERGS
jgi:hypothetical protein